MSTSLRHGLVAGTRLLLVALCGVAPEAAAAAAPAACARGERPGCLDTAPAGEPLVSGRRLARAGRAVRAAPDPEALAGRLASAFFAVPWRASLADWQARNPGAACEPFRGTSDVARADELWCTRCTSGSGSGEREYLFFPDAAGETCTLQKVRLSHPAAAAKVLPALIGRLEAGMGAGRPAGEVHDLGSAYWADVRRWRWKGVEVYAFRSLDNPDGATGGEGAPLVEVLAWDRGLRDAMELEEAAEQVVDESWRLREELRTARLHGDVAKTLPDLIPRLEKAGDPEARSRLLLELLSRMAPAGPDRAAHLYLADRLAEELGQEAAGSPEDGEARRTALTAHGVRYAPGIDGLFYNHAFRRRIVDEGLSGYWAEEAFLDWQLAGWAPGGPCDVTDQFREVIARGEAFLARDPASRIGRHVLLSLARAHETAWSLGQASPVDEYVEAARYQAGAEEHRKRAIAYYDRFLQGYPDSGEAVLARPRLVRLRLGVDTAARDFYCIYD